MNSKIKVDPRTFKIINPVQSQDQSHSQTTSDTESGSSTSVKSESDSIKVIKLDNPVQSGGEKQIIPEIKIQTKSVVPNPNNSNNTNLFNYLTIKNKNESQPEQNFPLTKSEAFDTESFTNEDSNNNESQNEQTVDEVSEDKQEVQSEKVDDQTQDIFDLTQNKLYQVLSKLFEDSKGNNISENIEKMSILFEIHNQTMEKVLNQLIIMNTNYKQVKVPDSFHLSTKQAGNIPDFRDQRGQKKP